MIIPVYDSTHANIAHLPEGHAAGYTTGTPDIRWAAWDWHAHPGAVRICQDALATDTTADVLDVERGAATEAECPGWAKDAADAYRKGARPGQRRPAIYASASKITPVVNALIGGGVTSGVGLVVADWNLTEPEAAAEVAHRSGPFPIVGAQWKSLRYYDVSVVASAWLHAVSAKPAPPAPGPVEWADWTAHAHNAQSLTGLALAHRTHVGAILRETVTHYGHFEPPLSTYLNEGRLHLAIPPGAKLRVPK